MKINKTTITMAIVFAGVTIALLALIFRNPRAKALLVGPPTT